MITKFASLFAGHTDVEDIGYGVIPINERRYDNAHCSAPGGRLRPSLRKWTISATRPSGWRTPFRPIAADAKSIDGLNLQIAVCDEIAPHRASEVYDVLLTATGKQRNPLLLCISTATGNNGGSGKQLWDYSVRVLECLQEDDRLFALIYTIDPEDGPWAEASRTKANPSWGQAVQPDAIRSWQEAADTPL